MQLVLFDFDGTITTDDSLINFIRYTVGDLKTLWGLSVLSPILVAYKLKLIPNYKAKEMMLSYFFKGMQEQRFLEIAEEYSLRHIDTILRLQAMEKVAWHQAQGHKVVVVSASMECWLKPWCDRHGLELIATRIERKDSIVTGRLLTKNCYGMEKVNRVEERFNLEEFDHVVAYGDSRGDRELLDLADESYYKPFREG